RARGTGFIVDDDRTISIADATVTAGDTGTTDAPLVLTLSSASPRPVTVTYTTADETATAPADYLPTTGTATIGAGELSTTITVPVVGDLLEKPERTFFVRLAGDRKRTR